MKITHLNKTFETIHYDTTLTSEDIQYIRDNFYNIYSLEEVNKQIYNIYYKNGKDDSAIYDYYFYELMCEAKLKGHKWTIKEFLESDDLIRYASAKVKSSIKIYPPQAGIIKNIRSVFRLSPSGTAAKLSNFPFGLAKDILETYIMKKIANFIKTIVEGLKSILNFVGDVCEKLVDDGTFLVQ